MRNDSERQLQQLGVFVHGILTGLHVLGMVYNFRRKNWADVLAHGGAALYDTYAVAKHMKALEKL